MSTLFTTPSMTAAESGNVPTCRTETELTIKAFSGEDARLYWQQIAKLRIEMFKEFPYLYEGTYEYEKEYLETYFKSKNSVILLVFDADDLVGFSNAIPLVEEMKEIQEPFLRMGIDIGAHLYVGEVMIQPPYRGRGLLRKFFEYHDASAVKQNCSKIVLMTVNRSDDHPCRPKNYNSPDPIWEHFGYHRLPEMDISMVWKQVDTHKDEVNRLALWQKHIN